MKSRLYSGDLGHCRHSPAVNQFSYKVFMLYLDLDEIDRVFNQILAVVYWQGEFCLV